MPARKRTKRGGATTTAAKRAALENAALARATGAGPAEMLAVAIASLGSETVGQGLAALRELGPRLHRLAVDGVPGLARRPARLERALVFDPELARVRRDLADHEIRGRLLFREIVGRRSFFQTAAWSIAGLELSSRDAGLLEHLGVNTQLLDPHIWPLAVTRRIAARGGRLGRSLVGGVASLFTPGISVEPVAAFMRFLDEVQSAVDGGGNVASFVQDELRRGRTIAGFGRPVLGPDERVPHAMALARRHRRAGGRSVRLARAVERTLREAKGLVINSAGVQGAIMRDMGFAPDGAAAFCALYFVVPLIAQHAFVVERRRGG
jgi:hypothetical protein